jgi:ABC-2 type transport system ATP-binding protein
MCAARAALTVIGMEITEANQLEGHRRPAVDHREPAVETYGLTKRFGDRIAVDDVSLVVPRGVAYGFLGHNGAGKTTLIRVLLGLTRASAGRASVLGLPVPAQRARALARVGAIVEEPSFYPHLTGYENLKVAAAVRGPETRARIEPVLERVGLDKRSRDRVGTYSLGMRQRLGVARCLLSDPELLILDEPMNGLDPGGMLDVRRMIRALVEDEGRTVFVSSHLLDEVEKTCDVAAIIDGGCVIAQGSIEELVADDGGELVIECDDTARALALLAGDPTVRELRAEHGALRMKLLARDQAGEVNSRLVAAGLVVTRLEPARRSLEDRFLEMTTRLEVAA